jgi:hypothetical protein
MVVRASSLMPIRGKSLIFGDSVVLAQRTFNRWKTVECIILPGLACDHPPDIFALMAKSLVHNPAAMAAPSSFAFRTSENVVQHMTIQAIRSMNVLLRPDPVSMPPQASFRSVPIEWH